jgi:hypothetical protein
MAIDPKAAAAAAQAAAEAARAAAEAAAAAAAAEAEAAARTTSTPTTPTLADSGKGEVLEETGVSLGAVTSGAFSGGDLRDLDAGMLAGSRDALASLPGLTSAVQIGGGITSPFDLESSFQSNRNPGFSSDSISSVFRVDWETDDAVLVSQEWRSGRSSITGQDGMYAVNGDGDDVHMSTDGTVRTIYDPDTGTARSYDHNTGTRTDYVRGADGTFHETGQYEVQSDDNPPAWSSGVSADEVTAWFNDFFGDDSDKIIIEDEDTSAGGSTGVSKPAPDEYGGYTGSWSGVTPIGPGSGDDDFVAGATGNTGSSTGGALGPQGGQWAINPGAEGFVAGRETDLRDAKEWYGGGVSQPEPLQELAGDPAMLEQGMQVVDPNTVNPSDGQGSTSDAGAQASTAYRTSYAPAQAGTAAAEAGLDTAEQVAQDEQPAEAGGVDANAAADVADEHAFDPGMADPADSMTPMSEDDDFGRDGHGGERGREFGQSQGKGHGRSDDEGDSEE